MLCGCAPDGLDLALDAVWETPPERCGTGGSFVGVSVAMAKGEAIEGIGDRGEVGQLYIYGTVPYRVADTCVPDVGSADHHDAQYIKLQGVGSPRGSRDLTSRRIKRRTHYARNQHPYKESLLELLSSGSVILCEAT